MKIKQDIVDELKIKSVAPFKDWGEDFKQTAVAIGKKNFMCFDICLVDWVFSGDTAFCGNVAYKLKEDYEIPEHMLSQEDMVERLKHNDKMYKDLSIAEKQTFVSVGTKNCRFKQTGFTEWWLCREPVFYDFNIYQIKEDYKVVEQTGVIGNTVDMSIGDLKTAVVTKDTNPKDALGTKKVPMHCVSGAVMMELGLAMMEGGRKYGTHNYRKIGVRASVYYDAAMRHEIDWWEGQDTDPDSNLHHITKAISTLVTLRDSMIMGNWVDDRPIRLPNKLSISKLNEKAAEIIKKYPECKKPFTQIKNLHDSKEFKAGSIVKATSLPDGVPIGHLGMLGTVTEVGFTYALVVFDSSHKEFRFKLKQLELIK